MSSSEKKKDKSRKSSKEKSVRSKSSKSHKSEKSSKSQKSKKSNKTGESQSRVLSNEKKTAEINLNNELSPNYNLQTISLNNAYGTSREPFINNIMPQPNKATNEADRCEGCFDYEAICYCKECEKAYCPNCDRTIHSIPAYKTHERMPLTQMMHLKKMCYHHNNPLKFYCESCEEPICHECQIIGPHNTKLHRIIGISEAFRAKYSYINNIVQNQLKKKFEISTANIDFIDRKISEIEDNAVEIEKDINISYNSFLEKLNIEKGKKIAILNFESANIQKDLVAIEEITNLMHDSSEEGDMISFLLRANQITAQIDEIISKPNEIKIDVDITKLPCDFEIQQNKLSNYEKLEKIIKLKDDIIWELLQKQNKLKKDIDKLKNGESRNKGEGSGSINNYQSQNNPTYSSGQNFMNSSLVNMGTRDGFNGSRVNRFSVNNSVTTTTVNYRTNNYNSNYTNYTSNNRYGNNSSIIRKNFDEKECKGIVTKIVEYTQKNNINLYQLFNSYCNIRDSKDSSNMDTLAPNDLIDALSKLGITIDSKQVSGILYVLGLKDSNKIPILDLISAFTSYKD